MNVASTEHVPAGLEPVATAVSAVVALILLYVTWRGENAKQLRREEVATWANQCIVQLQTLYLLCLDGGDQFSQSEISARMREIMIASSALAEQGRLFFRNASPGRNGQWKEIAYRGYRPVILDQLVLAHQIACAWRDASGDDRDRMALIAERCEKRFVSLAQQEIGRSRTASSVVRQGGDGTHLRLYLEDLHPYAVDQMRTVRAKRLAGRF